MKLIEAVIHNNCEEVKKILSAGVDPNRCLDHANVTPLHFAAQHNAIAVVDLLVTAGADIHARTFPDDQTPLDVAKLHGHEEMQKILEDYSSKIPFE